MALRLPHPNGEDEVVFYGPLHKPQETRRWDYRARLDYSREACYARLCLALQSSAVTVLMLGSFGYVTWKVVLAYEVVMAVATGAVRGYFSLMRRLGR